MKGFKHTKKLIAKVMTGVVALTTALAPIQAQAATVSYGSTSRIILNMGFGPDLSYFGGGYTSQNVFIGLAGYALTTGDFPAGVTTETYGIGPRPIVPTAPASNTFPGYTFKGFYDNEYGTGNVLEHFSYAFPYEDNTTYYAVWEADGAVGTYPLTVKHTRVVNGQTIEFKHSDAGLSTDSWISQVNVGDAVSETYYRTIPGYTINSASQYTITNNYTRTFAEVNASSHPGTYREVARMNDQHSLRGNMPNDDLTVEYRYVPDTSKVFNLRIEHYSESGVQLHAPIITQHSVEDPISASPLASSALSLPGYTYVSKSIAGGGAYNSAEITVGNTDDLEGSAVMSMETISHAISGASSATFDSNGNISGNMPNQTVTIRYIYELDTTLPTSITINQEIAGVTTNLVYDDTITAATEYTYTVPNLPGYVWTPNITLTTGWTINSFNSTTGELKLQTSTASETVNIEYIEDFTDPNWVSVYFYSGANGTLTDSSVRHLPANSTINLDDYLAGNGLTSENWTSIGPVADTNYQNAGWYYANSTQSGPTGSRLDGTGSTITVGTSDINLYYVFEEDPAMWVDVEFEAASNGSVSGGTTSIHVPINTSYTFPTATANANYLFDGWFAEDNSMLSGSNTQPFTFTLTGDQKYTARFSSLLNDDGLLAMPNLTGSIASDGTGSVSVVAPNSNRKYALTDTDGNILQIMTGTALQSSDFTGLTPSSVYQVYEILNTENPSVGDVLPTDLPAGTMSQPSSVVVPALGDNYTVQNDGTTGKKIVISPAAPNTVYAVMDTEGNVISQTGSSDGWVSSSGSPATLELTGLDPNTSYIVVAKDSSDSSTPSSKTTYGTLVNTTANSGSSTTATEYTLTLLNSGNVVSLTRNGVAQAITSGATTVKFQEGDVVRVSANSTDPSGTGTTFNGWSVLQGSLTIAYPTVRNQNITMPAGNVVLSATYAGNSGTAKPSTPASVPSGYYVGELSLDYTPKNSTFSVDTTTDLLLDIYNNNATDAGLLAGSGSLTGVQGQDVAYTIKFNKRTSTVATASDLVYAEVDDADAVTIPWSIEIGLAREVNGVNKPLVAGANNSAPITVYANLDNSQLGFTDYQLWKVDSTGLAAIELTTVPSLNSSDFTGSFSFNANIGDIIILSYYKTYEVTVIDSMRGTTNTFTVRRGTALDNSTDYTSLGIGSDYTDPTTGIVYEYKGVSRSQTGSTMYSTSSPVRSSLTLYVRYEQEDDTAWQNAKKKLQDLIDIANALANNSKVSAADKAALLAEIANAVADVNALPRRTIAQLNNEYDILKALVDSITNTTPSTTTYSYTINYYYGSTLLKSVTGSDNASTIISIPALSMTGYRKLASSPSTFTLSSDNMVVNVYYTRSGGGGGGGSSSGGGGGSGRTSGTIATTSRNDPRYVVGTDGNWVLLDAENHRWAFDLTDGTRLSDIWADLVYTTEDGRTETYKYHFASTGIMDSGWLTRDGQWYYLNTEHDGFFGRLYTGWLKDPQDNRWYYLDPSSGSLMTKGWKQIDNIWYYFAADVPEQTWFFNDTTGLWEYNQSGHRPLGSLYQNEQTPDGYNVAATGAWDPLMP